MRTLQVLLSWAFDEADVLFDHFKDTRMCSQQFRAAIILPTNILLNVEVINHCCIIAIELARAIYIYLHATEAYTWAGSEMLRNPISC